VHIPDATTGKYDADGYGISGERRKRDFWDEVIRYAQAHKDNKTILLGDFNTGLPEDAQGKPFVRSENIRILRFEKYVDTWRILNPRTREYTYFSKQKSKDYNGFRLDYVFVSRALRESVTNAEHVHHVREAGLSDHAMVLVLQP
jgi:exodeoxyribonuclease-3